MDAPDWHFASNTTRKRADGKQYFLFTGCRCPCPLSAGWGFLSREQLPPYEEKWDAEADRRFAEMTAHWTEPQRTAFRLRLGHVRHEPELISEDESAPAGPVQADEQGAF